jgi:hypothetical protein
MKFIASLAAALLIGPVASMAQVSMELVLDQEQYLPGESLLVGVRITNLSGQTLRLGHSADWLQFSVEARDRTFVVSRNDDPPVEGAFDLESSKVATRTVDIAPYFNLSRVGRYRVVATLKLDQWQQELSSPPRWFDIIGGARLWEQEFGVPPTTGTPDAGAPERRKYILQKASYLKQLRLYARITDLTETRTFRVLPLAKALSFGLPDLHVDQESRLHVLSQIGPRSFFYGIINPDGILLVRQTYDYTAASRPTLRVTDEGKVVVLGGVRRVATDDLPPEPVVSSPPPVLTPPTAAPNPKSDSSSKPKKKKK